MFRWTKGTPKKKKRKPTPRRMESQPSSWRVHQAQQDTYKKPTIDPSLHKPTPKAVFKTKQGGIRFSKTQQRNYRRWLTANKYRDTTANRKQFLRFMASLKKAKVHVSGKPAPDYDDFDWNTIYQRSVELPAGKFDKQGRRVVKRTIDAPTSDRIQSAKNRAMTELHKAEIRAMNTGMDDDVRLAESLRINFDKSFGRVPMDEGYSKHPTRFHGKRLRLKYPPKVWHQMGVGLGKIKGFIKRLGGEGHAVVEDKPKSKLFMRHPRRTNKTKWRDFEL
jgi:hypothetical protein